MRAISADRRPTDYEYALMSEHVYRGEDLRKGDALPKKADWKILDTKSDSMGYFGAIYINTKTHHMVLAHRGTDSLKALLEDLWGIAHPEGFSPQKKAAFVFLTEVIDRATSHGCQLSFTGHSLGAFLAELCVFHCHRTLKYEAVNAVTFESPGSRESLEKLQSNLEHERIDLTQLDIVAYMSTPNIINTYNGHVGTLYGVMPALGDYGWVPGWYLKKAHAMSGIVSYFERFSERCDFKYLTDWPIGSQKDLFFTYAVFNKERGRYELNKGEDELLSAKKEFYELTYKGHYHADELLVGQQALALRHFSRPMQDFLKTLYHNLLLISRDKDKQMALVSKWKEARIPEEITALLLGYHLVEKQQFTTLTVTAEGVDTFNFRRQLSSWLEEYGEKIVELLSLTVNSSEVALTEITAALIAPDATVSEGASVDATVMGLQVLLPKDVELIEHLQQTVKLVMASTSKISAYGIASGAKVSGKVSGSAIAVGVSMDRDKPIRGAGDNSVHFEAPRSIGFWQLKPPEDSGHMVHEVPSTAIAMSTGGGEAHLLDSEPATRPK